MHRQPQESDVADMPLAVFRELGACLGLCAVALAAGGCRARQSSVRSRLQGRLIPLRYQRAAQTCELDEAEMSSLTAKADEARNISPEIAQPAQFRHPPRSERMPKELPFSDVTAFPKALFPWSPEYGGRPWDAWTDAHKKRLLFMAAVHLGALAAPFTFSWGAFNAFAVFVLICTIGITLSYHRQLSHRAFECPKWLEYLFAYFGCLAVEGAPIGWVRMHRHHHVHSDKEDDIHSPLDGFWWSHMGFMFDASTTEKVEELDNVRDLSRQEFYRLMDDANVYVATSVLLPVLVLYALGGMPYVVWGFCLRTVYIWHVNWAVNSIGHVWGYQSYDSNDNSQNNFVFGLLGFGDGWHNNHHAFPRSCRHGLEWWELDLNWHILQLLSAFGLAWNLQLPSEKQKERLALH